MWSPSAHSCDRISSYGRLAQLVAQIPYKDKVGGSSPSSPTSECKLPAMGAFLVRQSHNGLEPRGRDRPAACRGPRPEAEAFERCRRQRGSPSSPTSEHKLPAMGAFLVRKGRPLWRVHFACTLGLSCFLPTCTLGNRKCTRQSISQEAKCTRQKRLESHPHLTPTAPVEAWSQRGGVASPESPGHPPAPSPMPETPLPHCCPSP